MFQEAIARYLQSSGYSQIQLKSVLFDMDGVLFNSMPYHAELGTRLWNAMASI